MCERRESVGGELLRQDASHFPNPAWGLEQRVAQPLTPTNMTEGLRALIHEALQAGHTKEAS